MTSALANQRTESTVSLNCARAARTLNSISFAVAPRRHPTPTMYLFTASVVVVITGSASKMSATARLSALAPPSCPDSKLTANRPMASTTTTAGSVSLLLSNGAILRTTTPIGANTTSPLTSSNRVAIQSAILSYGISWRFWFCPRGTDWCT